MNILGLISNVFISQEILLENTLVQHYLLIDSVSNFFFAFIRSQTIKLLSFQLEAETLDKKNELGPHHSASSWSPHGTYPSIKHQPAGFLRGGLLFAFEIKLCQNKEMKGMLGGVRWDEMGYGKWGWNVRRGTWLSSSGSGSKGFGGKSSRSQEGRRCGKGLRRDGTNLGTLPASVLPPSASDCVTAPTLKGSSNLTKLSGANTPHQNAVAGIEEWTVVLALFIQMQIDPLSIDEFPINNQSD